MLLKHGMIKGTRTMSHRCIKSEAGKNLARGSSANEFLFCDKTKKCQSSRFFGQSA